MAETTDLMARPSIYDKLTRKRALELFWPQVVAYLDDTYCEADRAYTERQLEDVLAKHYDGRDGYAMARDLENHYGWEEDRKLVDLMDNALDVLSDAQKELMSQWVKTYRIAPERKIGDSVILARHPRQDEVGTVVKIYEDEARYGVRYPDQPETSSCIVNFEDVKDVLTAADQG